MWVLLSLCSGHGFYKYGQSHAIVAPLNRDTVAAKFLHDPKHALPQEKLTTHPVRVITSDNKDYIGILSYFYSTTITGWGVLRIV